MTHRVTIGVCLAVAIAATIDASVAASARGAAFVAVTQTAVYGVVAAYSWVCRRHTTAPRVVLAAAGLAAPLTWAFLRVISQPTGNVAIGFVLLILFAQWVVVVLGGYLGFACVEARRLQHHNPGEVRGKLAVAGLFAIGVAAVVGLAASM